MQIVTDLARQKGTIVGFNSLFEMPHGLCWGVVGLVGFNSLFEMLITLHDLPPLAVWVVSILYLRCTKTLKLEDKPITVIEFQFSI